MASPNHWSYKELQLCLLAAELGIVMLTKLILGSKGKQLVSFKFKVWTCGGSGSRLLDSLI